MPRIVLIGDVGGFPEELARAAGDPGATVIQVGDLVDRGPDSSGALAFVKERLDREPRGWIQLVGNHEWQYLDGQPFWPERLDDADAKLLQQWWLTERIRVAAAVRTADGEEFLVTHAGLTLPAWKAIGEPVTAATAADLLNTRPERVLRSYKGPFWASAGNELYESWLDFATTMPFSQIHGHDAVVDYRRKEWRCVERVRQRSTVDWAARHTFTQVSGGRFIGIDPKHGRTGAPEWAPLVFPDATLLA
jgi:hypothetical protein